MMSNGLWVLMMVLEIGKYDIIYKPYAYYGNQQVCNVWKDRESREQGVKMTCVKQTPEF